MTYPTLTASRLELAAKCSGAFAHEHVETTGEAAKRGTQVHEYIAALLHGEELPPPRDQKTADLCRSLDETRLWEAARPDAYSTLYAEQALYLLPSEATGEAGILEGAYRRDYSGAPEAAITGTADAVAVGDSSVTVTDWKTGVRHESRLRGVVRMDPG